MTSWRKPTGAERRMEQHELVTDDGWRIHLHRYRPAGPPEEVKAPVLFVHGMGANRFNFDLNERLSLARWTAARGYDSWVVELRGRGLSPVPEGIKADWDFEDFLHRDVRKAVSFVREQTGQPMHWVGHSMGGMLGVAFAEIYGEADLRSLVLFGTPLIFGRRQLMIKLWGLAAQMHRFMPTLDQEKWGRRMLPLMSRSSKALDFFLRFLANPDNVDDQTIPEIFNKLVTNESPRIILQFSDWVRSGEFRSVDRSVSYSARLGLLRCPCMFVCGVNDLMAPPKYTRRQVKRLGSRQVRLVVLSRKNGFGADYGHGDLMIGAQAPDEVYPLVTRWFDQLGGATTAAAGG
jgi:pimeloyl-ACP methyl ester carboxylesterase